MLLWRLRLEPTCHLAAAWMSIRSCAHTLQNPVYVLDLIVVSTSLTFEGIMLSAKQPNITGGFLVFMRVWHFIRVGHGVHEIDDKVLQELAEDEEGGIRHPA